MPAPVETPVKPQTAPQTEPMRRMEPEKVCPDQRGRIAETIRRLLP